MDAGPPRPTHLLVLRLRGLQQQRHDQVAQRCEARQQVCVQDGQQLRVAGCCCGAALVPASRVGRDEGAQPQEV